ncbi:FAD-dependent dehydrogenase [Bacteroidia bacterium]|nr:FAD-dependent dehydrogenase [Bacteroidia bacterium]
MPKELTLTLTPEQAARQEVYIPLAARMVGVQPGQIALARIVRRSIDARRKLQVLLTLELFIDDERPPEPVRLELRPVDHAAPVVVVGCGPAGLFAALRLIEEGYKPILVERGKEVGARKTDIAAINRNGQVDPDSNYAFGEGGAGAFSDGKLFTRSKKRGDHHRALHILLQHGADPSILYDAHPHVGTDRLPGIIARIRQTIIEAGGEVCFGQRVTDLIVKDGRCLGVICGDTTIEGRAVILATGHSADDIYMMLHRRGVPLQAKPFAMGVRVEHPQTLIDTIQYRLPSRGDHLPAATYQLVAQVGGRGVYSFCMCPGGHIVPAMTSASESVVNGMSTSGRNSLFANAGIVAEIRPADWAHLDGQHGPLAGLVLRQQFEQAAREHGGAAQIAPAQRLTDFVAGRPSSALPRTSYPPGVAPSQMEQWMPPFISEALRGGFVDFGRRMRGFLTDQAQIVGVESRTSSPVRIPRDGASLMHPAIEGLFPSGEGAGYAGGIISAAVDGDRSALATARYLKAHNNK